MLRIGIVGSENSHSIAYSRLVNIERVLGDDARVVAISGEQPARTREVADQGQIPAIFEESAAMVGQVDAVIVDHRDGADHAVHAIPFLERRIPVFVDKPLAVSLEDCRRIIDTATASGTMMTSFSAFRCSPVTIGIADRLADLGPVCAAQLAGPCDFASQYSGPFFYATHTVEIALRLLGYDVRTVRATRIGEVVTVTATWNDALPVTLTFVANAAYQFHVTLYGAQAFHAEPIPADDDCYRGSLRVLDAAFRSGTPPLTPRQLLTPIAFVHAVQVSLASDGAPIDVAAPITAELGLLAASGSTER